MMVHACKPGAGNSEKQKIGLWGMLASHHSLLSKSQASKRTCLKKKVVSPEEQQPHLSTDLHGTHRHGNTHLYPL